jgi:hypothetical protein
MEGLSRTNARVFVYVMERVPAQKPGRSWSYQLQPEGLPVLVAAAPLAAGPGISLVFTLGGARRILVTLTDGDPSRVGASLARAERAAPAEGTALALPLEDPYLAENGRAGLALLPPSTGRWFPELPDAVRFDAEVFPVSMVAFLTGRELADAQANGLDRLAAAFQLGQRDLVRLGGRERG